VTSFSDTFDQFLEAAFALDPLFATVTGNHDHDGRWADLSEAGRVHRLRFSADWSATFAAFGDDVLTVEERVDRDLLLGELEVQRFGDEVLREDAWSPLWWVYVVGGGLFDLLAREFAPLAIRLGSLADRAEGLPAILAAARETLVGLPDRPVDRLHAEKAIEQWPGLISIVDEAIETGEAAAAGGDDDVAAMLPRLRAARATASGALDAFEDHLRATILPASSGEGRLGPELFAAKLAHTMRDRSITTEHIRAEAEREFAAVRAEMVRIAREIAPQWLGDGPIPDDEGALVRAVIDAIAAEHPTAEGLLDFCRGELDRIVAFCGERGVITVPDDPLEIDWTPVFLRQYAGAMLSWPGVFDRGQKSFFHITPVPADATPEQAESRLREDNDRMLTILTIHEAVPGHYLQGVYSSRVPSLIRAVFRDGVYAEGWAVYVTQVMMDAGLAETDPALLLCHWKYYLRSATNALIDVGIHTAGMTEAEAIELMVDGAFQEMAAARAKYDRARLSSTQLSTYFVGSMAFWELEREVRERAAVAAGAGPDAVPEPRVVGGFGETPGFDQREHLERCVSHGGPPIPLLRRLVLG
jgi:uncharacterized protein (DUF885 family)